jgi:hypothetical protein
MSINNFNDAMDAMPGSRLVQTNYNGQAEFWIPPSYRVAPSVAKQIINHPQIIGGKDALFPGHHQTWRMCPSE